MKNRTLSDIQLEHNLYRVMMTSKHNFLHMDNTVINNHFQTLIDEGLTPEMKTMETIKVWIFELPRGIDGLCTTSGINDDMEDVFSLVINRHFRIIVERIKNQQSTCNGMDKPIILENQIVKTMESLRPFIKVSQSIIKKDGVIYKNPPINIIKYKWNVKNVRTNLLELRKEDNQNPLYQLT